VSVTAAHNWSESEQQAVRAQLDRIVNSGSFQHSQRRQRFLGFLVAETLAGRGDRLKGYTIAVEVFDRPASFDPVIDPLVRVEAGRLREKLRDYYDRDGAKDLIRIDLLKGTYAPHIEFRQKADDIVLSQPSTALVAAAPMAPAADGAVASVDHDDLAITRTQKSALRWRAALVAVAVLAVIGALAWWQHALQPLSSAGKLEGSRGPVVAVLPFTNLSGDPSQEYFSDGLTEDILTELSRTRDLVVLARSTTFQFKGQAADIAKLNRDLKADYAIEGSIQRSGDRIRVTAQLIDAQTGNHVWADRFEKRMADIFLIQDQIVGRIVAKITGGYGVIEVAESKSAKLKNSGEIEAYDLVLRAQDAMRPEWSRQTFKTAKDYLKQAISLDPANSRALRELAYLSALGWVFRFDAKPVLPEKIIAQAVKSVQLDPDDARARMVAAASYFWTNQMDLFDRESQQALRLAPFDGEILAAIGSMYAKSGQWARGVALVEKAYALNAYAASGWYQSTVGLDAYLKGDYERALAMLRQSSDQGTFYIYLEYIPIYGQLGRKDDALVAWRKLLEEEPTASAETFLAWYRLWNTREKDVAKFMDGVSKSGVLLASQKPAN
jgi:adenylate cyclase